MSRPVGKSVAPQSEQAPPERIVKKEAHKMTSSSWPCWLPETYVSTDAPSLDLAVRCTPGGPTATAISSQMQDVEA
eukprot:566188-Prymnesium_polylepis.2